MIVTREKEAGVTGSWDPEVHGWLAGFYGGPDELAIFTRAGLRYGASDEVPDIGADEVQALVDARAAAAARVALAGATYRVLRFVGDDQLAGAADAEGATFPEMVAAVTGALVIVGLMRTPGKTNKALMLLGTMVDHYSGQD